MKASSIRFFFTVFISILSFISIKSFSQNSFGITASLGVSKELNSHISTSFKPDFDFCGYYSLDLFKSLDLRFNVGYKQRGYKDEMTLNYSGETEVDKTTYHLISAGPDFIFPIISRKNTLFLLTGLNLNYLLAESFAFKNNYESSVPYYLNRFQVDAVGGFGMEFHPGILLEFEISGSILNKANKLKSPDLTAHDLYFGFAVGYSFMKRQNER